MIQVAAFGSSCNGFWASGSDIDISVIFYQRLEVRPTQLLGQLKQAMVQGKIANGRILEIFHTKVPILKFQDAHFSMDIDLNVNNTLGVHNSELLYQYARIDQRFHIMVMVVKKWAKEVGIIGANKGYFTSYTVILMVLAFLQY